MPIKPIPSIHILACLAATASLVACANPSGAQDHGQHHAGPPANAAAPGSSASPAQGGSSAGSMMGSHAGSGMMGGSEAAGPGGMQHMNKERMCEMYRRMRDAPNEEARQAMMDRQMQGMSPDMRQQHMEMMRQQCQ